jgi:hypothetical protein
VGTGWIVALEKLCGDRDYRYEMVRNAQAKLRRRYSLDRLRRQMLQIFDLAAGKTIVALPEPDADEAPPEIFRPTRLQSAA